MTDTTTQLEIVEQTVRIEARLETVWTFWTDEARICEWMGIEAELVPETGGTFRVVLEEGPVTLGEFLELDPPRRLVFSFGWEGGALGGALPAGSTQVEITLEADADATVLTLRHELPSPYAADHAKGWAHFVGRLVARLGPVPS